MVPHYFAFVHEYLSWLVLWYHFDHGHGEGSVTATRRAESWPEVDRFSDVTCQRPGIERSEARVPIPLSG
ncbi:MAG: hypothetical protein ACI8PT_004913 [Gammaproteobacteria bacterium]|jgi:hypothetical protein